MIMIHVTDNVLSVMPTSKAQLGGGGVLFVATELERVRKNGLVGERGVCMLIAGSKQSSPSF